MTLNDASRNGDTTSTTKKDGSVAKKSVPRKVCPPPPTAKDSKSFFNRDGSIAALIQGNSLEVLKTLPADSFNVAVTSPPYFWARDYGYEGQIGHEDDLEHYVAALADVFDEVQRTLHPEGVFFLNIGDTYYSGRGQPHGSDPRAKSRQFMRSKLRAVDKSGWGLPKKSLIGVPWKVAFEMQRRGWTLRADIIWNRCNAHPEPTAKDRPHRQYEHLFMFAKTRFYSFDRSALPQEDVWDIPIERNVRINHNAAFPSDLVKRCVEIASPLGGKVLDPFVGSGTTLDVATSLGRHALGIDMSPTYVQQVWRFFRDTGATGTTEAAFLDALAMQSPYWDEWAGNKRNRGKKPSR